MPVSTPVAFKPAVPPIALGAAGTVLTGTGAASAPTFQVPGPASYAYLAPLTGFVASFDPGVLYLVLEPAGTLATGTVTLPASPRDGLVVHLNTTQAITALTIVANAVPAGQVIADAPTTLPIGGAVGFLYRAANTTWYRVHN